MFTLFRNRLDAALQLIDRLNKYRDDDGLVLAVPRGGVPIGYYIARNYNIPLELLYAKKIGHPMNNEVAIGAVSLEDEVIDDFPDVSGTYIMNEIGRIRTVLKENQARFSGGKKPTDLKDKTVIVVDDGVATGNTLLAAVKMIRKRGPRKIVVAIPVAPAETAQRLRGLVDELICLHEATEFYGVGQFYQDFAQVDDDEVVALLREVNRMDNAA